MSYSIATTAFGCKPMEIGLAQLSLLGRTFQPREVGNWKAWHANLGVKDKLAHLEEDGVRSRLTKENE